MAVKDKDVKGILTQLDEVYERGKAMFDLCQSRAHAATPVDRRTDESAFDASRFLKIMLDAADSKFSVLFGQDESRAIASQWEDDPDEDDEEEDP